MKNVLILCTGNSARSVLGEGLIHHLGAGRYRAFSAGSKPMGRVNPFALETLAAHGMALPEARSKSWDEFAKPDSPPIDFVFTVCDSANNEECPYFPGPGVRAHWGIEDPSHVAGDDAAKRAAFELAYQKLRRKVEAFVALDLDALPAAELKQALTDIGKLD